MPFRKKRQNIIETLAETKAICAILDDSSGESDTDQDDTDVEDLCNTVELIFYTKRQRYLGPKRNVSKSSDIYITCCRS